MAYKQSAVLLTLTLLTSLAAAGCLDDGGDSNHAPQAKITNPGEIETGKEQTFTGSATDEDGDELTYFWDFDADDGSDEDANAKSKSAAWTYYEAGSYTVTLLVSDGELTDKATLVVKVVKPEGRLEAKLTTADDIEGTLDQGETATINLDGSESENTEGGKDNIIKYEWDFSYDHQQGFEVDKDTGDTDSTEHDFPSGSFLVALRITNTTEHQDLSNFLLVRHNFNSTKTGTVTDNPITYKLPVNTLGVYKIRAELRYDAGAAHSRDLDLSLSNADDDEVARNDTHDRGQAHQVNIILLDSSNETHAALFDDEDELGEWSVTVEYGYSTADADFTLYLDVIYWE